MANVIVIPARYASTRFPGKLLRDDSGWPLIRHVYARCQEVRGVDRVVVAADGERIAEAVEAFGGEVVLTDEQLPSGTDRVAAAIAAMGVTGGGTGGGTGSDDRIVNVQGDEPEIDPAHIERLFELLVSADVGTGAIADVGTGVIADVSTLAVRRTGPEGLEDPNRVKVVTTAEGRALYFSRAAIPFPRGGFSPATRWLYHVGVYGFRPGALAAFAAASPTPLEEIEKLEQLRFLELGFSMRVGIVEKAATGIDTPEDYSEFLNRLRRSGWRPESG